ncbi:MAG: ClbS/DfsB family four-helix bundle protein [Leptospiraceae bacterium]|nr:ClbS/DfsB family four-helix bundle protein [Leptospiraceae bacterium]MCP5499065.1 ClbS/DfsB family four-helix bundle protein [Leptospiraceae bacterium]
MARPKNKTELLDLSKKNFEFLMDFIENLSQEEQNAEFPKGTMNRNIRDVLMHLHHWHLMMLEWYTIGMKGEKPDMPAKGYTWKTTPELNRWIWEKYRDTSLKEAKLHFKSSYKKIRSLIEKHNDEELFEKKKYKWTGTTSLGAYLVSATSSHYDWGIKLIKKAKK